MHFILSPVGSAGDVHPFVGLGLELKRRGHDVTLVVHGYFRELVERHQLTYVEMGTKEEFLSLASHPDLWKPTKAFGHIFRRGILPQLRSQYRILADRYVPGESVAILSCLGMGGRCAYDRLGMPVVTLHLQPAVLWSDFAPPHLPGLFGPPWLRKWLYRLGETLVIDRIACPELNRFRAELGLEPVRHLTRWWHSPWQVVCLFPDWFAPPQPDWPSPLAQTNFPLWDAESDQNLDPKLDSFLNEGDAPLAFTPGSANVFGERFFQESISICQRLGRRGLLLSRFSEHIPPNLPANIRHVCYAPFEHLLPRCAALIHHGGVGSTAQGLAAGIPQWIVAQAHDQYDNGERIAALGVGGWTTDAQFRAARTAPRLQGLLDDDRVTQACQSFRNRLKSCDGIRSTAEFLERRAAVTI